MQRLDGQLVLSPTDLTHHQECRHLTWLDLGVAAGEWARPDDEVSEELQLVFDRVYDGGPYRRGAVDYSKPPEPPLIGADAQWAAERARAAEVV